MQVCPALRPIRILLANHQPIVRSGLRLLLEREPQFQVVAEAADGREAGVLLEFKRPDIALLEIKLPQVSGIAIARQIVSAGGASKPLFLTVQTEIGYVMEAFKAGARGYVAADSAPADLARAIRIAAAGGSFLSLAIYAKLLEGDTKGASLTGYEKELLCLLAGGYNEEEAAIALDCEGEESKPLSWLSGISWTRTFFRRFSRKASSAHVAPPVSLNHIFSTLPWHSQYVGK